MCHFFQNEKNLCFITFTLEVSVAASVFAGIDFMINLHGCIAVFEKKKVGMLEEAGKELMVKWTIDFQGI